MDRVNFFSGKTKKKIPVLKYVLDVILNPMASQQQSLLLLNHLKTSSLKYECDVFKRFSRETEEKQ